MKRLTDELTSLKSENAELKKTIENNTTEESVSRQQERDLLQSKLEKTKEELDSARVEATQVEKELEQMKESNKAALEVVKTAVINLFLFEKIIVRCNCLNKE